MCCSGADRGVRTFEITRDNYVVLDRHNISGLGPPYSLSSNYGAFYKNNIFIKKGNAMSRRTEAGSNGGIGFVGLLTILFIGLKLTGYIAWSWLWVISPIWISLGFWTVIFIIAVVASAFSAASEDTAKTDSEKVLLKHFRNVQKRRQK